MGSEEARRFVKSIKAINPDQQAMQLGNSARRQSKEIEQYSAPRGTAHNKNQTLRKRPRKLNLKLAALLLAAGIGTGMVAIKISGSLNPKPQITVTQLQEMGIDTGLEEDTLEKMVKYDEYFDSYDKDAVTNLTDNDVVAMIDDVSQLNEEALEEKIADLMGVTADSVDLTIGHNDEIGPCPRVTINKGEETQSYVYDQNFLLGIGKENSISGKISDLILQTTEYEDLKNDVLNDKITKANAIERLKELYGKISKVVASAFSIDGRGNITVNEYDKPIQHGEKTNKDDIER